MYVPRPHIAPDLAGRRIVSFNERLIECEAAQPGYIAKWDRLCERIAATGHDGDVIVGYGTPDPRVDLLLSEGAMFDAPVRRVPGVRNQCHANACELAADNSDLLIGTGYASYGGHGDWYSHSWGYRSYGANGEILETTGNDFTYYWGITITYEQSEELVP